MAASGVQAAPWEAATQVPTPPSQPAVFTTLLMVTTDPPGALVAIDGRPVGFAPILTVVPAGIHRVDSRLGGFYPDARMVELAQVASQTIAVVLNPTPEEALQRAAALEAAAKENARRAEAAVRYRRELGDWQQATAPLQASRLRDSWYGGVTVGVGSALLLAATVLGVTAAQQGGEAHDRYDTNQDPALFSEYRGDIESARTRLRGAAVMAGVGIPLVAAGAIILGRRAEVPAAPKPPSLRLEVGVGSRADGGSLSAVGRF